MSKPFCGVGKTPKGKKTGDMRECAELGQVRRYGTHKIDPRTLTASKQEGAIKETREQLIKQVVAAKGSKKRIELFINPLEGKISRGIATEQDKTKLKELKSELKKADRVLKFAQPKLKKIFDAEEKQKKKTAAKTKAVLDKTGTQAAKEMTLAQRKKIVEDSIKRMGTKRKTAADFKAQQKKIKSKSKSKKPARRAGTKRKTKA